MKYGVIFTDLTADEAASLIKLGGTQTGGPQGVAAPVTAPAAPAAPAAPPMAAPPPVAAPAAPPPPAAAPAAPAAPPPPAASPTPSAAKEPPPEGWTEDHLKSAAKVYAVAHSPKALKAILDGYGVKKITDVPGPKWPEVYFRLVDQHGQAQPA